MFSIKTQLGPIGKGKGSKMADGFQSKIEF